MDLGQQDDEAALVGGFIGGLGDPLSQGGIGEMVLQDGWRTHGAHSFAWSRRRVCPGTSLGCKKLRPKTSMFEMYMLIESFVGVKRKVLSSGGEPGKIDRKRRGCYNQTAVGMAWVFVLPRGQVSWRAASKRS